MSPTNKLKWVCGDLLMQWWAPVRDGQECPDGEWREIAIDGNDAIEAEGD